MQRPRRAASLKPPRRPQRYIIIAPKTRIATLLTAIPAISAGLTDVAVSVALAYVSLVVRRHGVRRCAWGSVLEACRLPYFCFYCRVKKARGCESVFLDIVRARVILTSLLRRSRVSALLVSLSLAAEAPRSRYGPIYSNETSQIKNVGA